MSAPALTEQDGQGTQTPRKKSQELGLFVFLTVIFFPFLAVAVVGGFGFLVWMIQLILGPPGPPG